MPRCGPSSSVTVAPGYFPGRCFRKWTTSRSPGRAVEQAFLDDVADGAFAIDWGVVRDLERSRELDRRYRSLKLGLVDTIVMAVAERREAEAIATLDERHFGAVTLRGKPRLLPRDR